jgi:hypothetical protein
MTLGMRPGCAPRAKKSERAGAKLGAMTDTQKRLTDYADCAG